MTEILPVGKEKSREVAAKLLRKGQVIGLPTDTIYGVAALAFNVDAVAEIFRLKRRPQHKALPVFVASIKQLPKICAPLSQDIRNFLDNFLPGALTVILQAHPSLPGIVTNYGDTVAVRIPDHGAILSLLARVDAPLVVTSANISDHPTSSTAIGVAAAFDGRLPLVLDGGKSAQNIPSTIVDMTQSSPKILREGVISAKTLLSYLHE